MSGGQPQNFVPFPPTIPSSGNFESLESNKSKFIDSIEITVNEITANTINTTNLNTTNATINDLTLTTGTISTSPVGNTDIANKLYVDNTSGSAAGGPDTSIQYNDNSSFMGSSTLTFNGTDTIDFNSQTIISSLTTISLNDPTIIHNVSSFTFPNTAAAPTDFSISAQSATLASGGDGANITLTAGSADNAGTSGNIHLIAPVGGVDGSLIITQNNHQYTFPDAGLSAPSAGTVLAVDTVTPGNPTLVSLTWDTISATPGGTNQSIQYNDNGSLGGATATWNNSTNLLSLPSTNTIATNSNNITSNINLISAGDISLNGSVLFFNQTDTGLPSVINRTGGTRIVLNPQISGSSADIAIGTNGTNTNASMWLSVPKMTVGTQSQNNRFKFYGGNFNFMDICTAINQVFDVPGIDFPSGEARIITTNGGSNSDCGIILDQITDPGTSASTVYGETAFFRGGQPDPGGNVNMIYSILTGQLLYASSTRSIKKNIRDIDQLDDSFNTSLIYQLKPRAFEMIESNITDFGFIAEEVAEVHKNLCVWNLLPDEFKEFTKNSRNLSKQEKDELYNSLPKKPSAINYDKYVTLCIAELQKHEQKIKMLEDKIIELTTTK